MKKIIAFLLMIFMVFSLAACSGNDDSEDSTVTEPQSSAEDTNSHEDENNSEAVPENTELAADAEGTQTDDSSESSDESSDTGKILVAYFSATNTTKGVAETIADSLNADLYEITPEDPYTDADLDYNDDKSRSTIEMNDSKARPKISGSVENMDQYEIVFIGYPIWWGDAPRILSTFVESYDFSGKTIVPFCTSGGSGIGSSAKNLEKLTSGATWLSGQRLSSGASHSSVVEWINGLKLDVTAE